MTLTYKAYSCATTDRKHGVIPNPANQDVINVYEGDMRIVTITNWEMGSCACASLRGFGVWSTTWTKQRVDELVALLRTDLWGGYQPREFYFLITNKQRTEILKELVEHKCVKLIDEYKNKSHKPHNIMYLYRLSLAKDFK